MNYFDSSFWIPGHSGLLDHDAEYDGVCGKYEGI